MHLPAFYIDRSSPHSLSLSPPPGKSPQKGRESGRSREREEGEGKGGKGGRGTCTCTSRFAPHRRYAIPSRVQTRMNAQSVRRLRCWTEMGERLSQSSSILVSQSIQASLFVSVNHIPDTGVNSAMHWLGCPLMHASSSCPLAPSYPVEGTTAPSTPGGACGAACSPWPNLAVPPGH